MSIHRRDILLGSGALALGSMAGAKPPKPLPAAPAKDGYFLSASNPIANRDQQYLEALAIRLMSRPAVQAAVKRTANEWALVTDKTVSRELWSMFPGHIASYAFRSMLLAVNSDPNFPRVLRIYSPEGKWLGNDVPDSKWGAENPDNAYRIIPIAHGGRYVIHGQRQPNPSSHASYVLVSDTNTSITEGLLEQKDLDIAPDGTFAITLDATPANGRRNHLQVTPETLYLFIRDSMGDWRQAPDALRVQRLNPPARAPLSEDELAARAGRVMRTGVAQAYYWIRLIQNIPVNTLSKPQLTGASGGLLTQLSSGGWFRLADDEAFVINANSLKAAYHSFVTYDLWNRTLEYRDHQTSLNNSNLAANPDGRHTIVIAHRDPGVRNWIDTTGQHEFSASFRWQGIVPGQPNDPQIETRVVKFAELAGALPPGVPMVTQDERARQLAERRQLFDRRFIDS